MKTFDGVYTQDDRKYARRLLILRSKLLSLPSNRWDYGTWAGTDTKPFKGKRDLSCGTVACALGWACTLPFAKKEGVYLYLGTPGVGEVEHIGGDIPSKILFGLDDDGWEGFLFLGCGHESESEYDFFTFSNARHGMGFKATAKQVCNRIEDTIRYLYGYSLSKDGKHLVRVKP